MINEQDIETAETQQIQIINKIAADRPHLRFAQRPLPVNEAVPLLRKAFESLAFLDPRIGDLSGLIADQRAFLAR